MWSIICSSVEGASWSCEAKPAAIACGQWPFRRAGSVGGATPVDATTELSLGVPRHPDFIQSHRVPVSTRSLHPMPSSVRQAVPTGATTKPPPRVRRHAGSNPHSVLPCPKSTVGFHTGLTSSRQPDLIPCWSLVGASTFINATTKLRPCARRPQLLPYSALLCALTSMSLHAGSALVCQPSRTQCQLKPPCLVPCPTSQLGIDASSGDLPSQLAHLL